MLRVRVGFSGIGGTPYLSTYYFNGTGQTAANDAVAAIGTFMGVVDNHQDTALTWRTDPQVVEINVLNGQATSSYATTVVTSSGLINADNLPFVSQGLLQLRTGTYYNGREVRGRIFIPGLTDGANTNGTLATSVASPINGAAAALIANGATEWVVYSRANRVIQPVIAASCWDQFATLRTRRPSF